MPELVFEQCDHPQRTLATISPMTLRPFYILNSTFYIPHISTFPHFYPPYFGALR